MKIGILTYHKSINFGAFMQCYSLVQNLKRDFPDCEFEVIDYIPKRTENTHNISMMRYLFGTKENKLSFRSSIIRLVFFLKDTHLLIRDRIRIEAFKNDWQFLPLSKKTYYEGDYQSFLDEISEIYDAVIVGSDGVWEFVSYPFPNPFYLGNDKIKARFSYAASSDRMYFPKVSVEQGAEVKKSLTGYEFLGVRDIATENFVNSCCSEVSMKHTCDPTIVLNLNDLPKTLDRVIKQLEDNGIDISKPVICIMGDDNIGKLVRDIFGNKYQVVAVYNYTKYADYYLNDITPLEWAQCFSLFAITFTRFFHGTILSLKNGTPTITLDPWHMEGPGHITKIRDLYMRLDLEEHCFELKKEYSRKELEVIKNRTEFFINNPDSDKISNAINKEGRSYQNFREAFLNWKERQ